MATTYTDKERDLQWKFRWETTTELEYKLMSANWMTPAEQADIEFELVRRGSTYIRRSYYDRPSKFFGSDGSSLSIATAGRETGRTIYDWDNIIAAEAAYVDEVLAKPIPKVSGADMGKFLDSQKAMIRRVVPGLISMDSISGIQPMTKHIDVLPFFKAMKTKPFEDYTLTKDAIDGIIAADKDLQPTKSRYYDTQKIGRGLREPTIHFGDLHIMDYMGLLHTNEPSKTNIGLTAMLDRIKNSGATQASFFDTESTAASTAISGDFFGKVDTTDWITQYKADTAKYIEDAMNLRRPYYADIMDDSVKFTYPITNLCCEESSSMTFKGTEMSFNLGHTELWDMYLSSMKQATRELYGTKVGSRSAIVTAKAPDFTSSMMMDCASGIEPIRGPRMQDFFVSEMKAYQPDVMIHATTPVDEPSPFEMKVLKNRKHGSGTVKVDFNVSACAGWGKWATLAESTEQPDPEDVRVSETLALLGIGEPQ